ncbi:MAG: MarR family transcriptional regulator [Planctomycetes bacterium]|nr:MarR family transcriptional regulator [Planctomycetota bacterium]
MALRDDIKLKRPFANDGVHALLLMARTLTELFEPALVLARKAGVSPVHHNVLRILRGAGAQGLPAGVIADRMVARDPDLTRLVDRMEKLGLVKRERSEDDRRVVLCRITRKGLAVCQLLEDPLNELHRAQFAKLGRHKTRQLIGLLEDLRDANRRTETP